MGLDPRTGKSKSPEKKPEVIEIKTEVFPNSAKSGPIVIDCDEEPRTKKPRENHKSGKSNETSESPGVECIEKTKTAPAVVELEPGQDS